MPSTHLVLVAALLKILKEALLRVGLCGGGSFRTSAACTLVRLEICNRRLSFEGSRQPPGRHKPARPLYYCVLTLVRRVGKTKAVRLTTVTHLLSRNVRRTLEAFGRYEGSSALKDAAEAGDSGVWKGGLALLLRDVMSQDMMRVLDGGDAEWRRRCSSVVGGWDDEWRVSWDVRCLWFGKDDVEAGVEKMVGAAKQ
ncbi:uncharacterized protein K452DRAFT_311950 [Aplosporella prunicola CBS 121167]|uniref:Uncharacterized protein n=1 Tax=Aplosporella prunicola CBS 121167 TaxID=1176127 RepID=A0A6A6B4Y9_9PEZI|nr:uncharacterized protein K452DRAFT_311950 [Aplosporella prunicola CBS 121167]KAF2137811.1 hypothetical protein K452DRAFT_311950 [Aplosporella prunicola CBS 121167]